MIQIEILRILQPKKSTSGCFRCLSFFFHLLFLSQQSFPPVSSIQIHQVIDLIKASRTHQAKNLVNAWQPRRHGDTTSCICQESREGTLRSFLHNSHFATQASHIRKLPFDVASFQGRVVYNFFLGCARRTKWSYIHKYSFSFGVGSDFQFSIWGCGISHSSLDVLVSWHISDKTARAVEVFNGWVLPQLK